MHQGTFLPSLMHQNHSQCLLCIRKGRKGPMCTREAQMWSGYVSASDALMHWRTDALTYHRWIIRLYKEKDEQQHKDHRRNKDEHKFLFLEHKLLFIENKQSDSKTASDSALFGPILHVLSDSATISVQFYIICPILHNLSDSARISVHLYIFCLILFFCPILHLSHFNSVISYNSEWFSIISAHVCLERE
jgi:hypothetical protein